MPFEQLVLKIGPVARKFYFSSNYIALTKSGKYHFDADPTH